MPTFSSKLFYAALAVAACQSVFSHDLGQMEKHMAEAEPYAQIVSKEAPGFSLEDPEGRKFSLSDFRGKAVVLYFLYTRCKDDCPLHSLQVKKVQDQIAAAGLKDQVQFVAVATDIEDGASTAQLMREHPKHYGLDTANWVILHGGPERERAGMEVAKAYGLEFRPLGESVQLHGIVTHLVDPQGQMRARYHGLDFDSVSLVSYAAALLHGEHGATRSDQEGPAKANLSPMDWVLSAVGLLCLAVLTWAGWSLFNSRASGRGKIAAPDS
ncbi:MAG: SCO family protein [Gammaproteobacteria bacterium]|nr:SCO family protein [Gammaproteobacteria bacterium]MDH3412974.1 SCO family protein [Gammaproteobacteria bacterium]